MNFKAVYYFVIRLFFFLRSYINSLKYRQFFMEYLSFHQINTNYISHINHRVKKLCEMHTNPCMKEG